MTATGGAPAGNGPIGAGAGDGAPGTPPRVIGVGATGTVLPSARISHAVFGP